MSILDHAGLPVSNYARARAFFDRALAPLGISMLREYGPVGGYGRDGHPEFWISERATDAGTVMVTSHFCFTARTRAEVEAFHREALAAGGKDHGAPGVREQYHPHYYAAFVLDADGHNIEAVCHQPG